MTIQKRGITRNKKQNVNIPPKSGTKSFKGFDTLRQTGNGTQPGAKKKMLVMQEYIISYKSRIRAIGNSKGIILSNEAIATSGLRDNANVEIKAGNGFITIMQAPETEIHNDLLTWDKEFKVAIKKYGKSEKDMFSGMSNDFDRNEW